jgi:hypothetical protein
MSDLTALAEKLASLHSGTDIFENGTRVIAQGGVPSGMAALVRAIDDTVLERTLEIMTGTHIVTLVVAGRRLRGITGVVPAKGKSARLVGEPLARDDHKTLEAVGALLTELLSAAPRITLRSLPAERFGKSGDRGVAAKTLIDVWNIDMDAAPLPPVQRFLRGNDGVLKAYVHLSGGEIVDSDGDISGLQAVLDDQLDDFLATRLKLSGNAEGPQLMSLEGALPGDKALALAQSEDDMILLIYEPTALGQIHASWQAVFQ